MYRIHTPEMTMSTRSARRIFNQSYRLVGVALLMSTSKIMTAVRLAFKCGVWKPSAAEWVLAMSSIQPEERERIRRFVFRKHTRSALVS